MKLSIQGKIFVAGHRGLVGSAFVRALEGNKKVKLITANKSVDLRNQNHVHSFFNFYVPEYVILAAARVGGITANISRPGEMIYDNLMIQSNVIEACRIYGVKKLLFLGSSCIYPAQSGSKGKIKETRLLTGPLEPTNEAYAIAKIAGIKMCEAYWEQYHFKSLCVMPTNLYGPNDRFDENAHVIPALIREFVKAKREKKWVMNFMGTGNAHREFLHVDDLVRASLLCFEREDKVCSLINIGSGEEIRIRDLVELIAKQLRYPGQLHFTGKGPDGVFRKPLDSTHIRNMGWKPKVSLEKGIRQTIKWYQSTKSPR